MTGKIGGIEMRFCNYCGTELVPQIDLGTRPIVNDLSSSVALNAKQYLIEMAVCINCGLHQVLHQINQEEFYTDYMTPSNWKNEPHLLGLINQISNYVQHEDLIIDIGCNDGKFLLTLRELGFKKLFGVEPTQNTANIAKKAGINVTHRYFNLQLAQELVDENGQFNVVVTRQVLEHITDIKDFLLSIRILLRDNGYLVIEIPDSEINFKHSDYGIWEEHVNYFTQATLSRILNEMGWEVSNWYRSVFSGWCQTFIATPKQTPEKLEIEVGRQNVTIDIQEFNEWVTSYPKFKTNVHSRIDSLVGKDGRIALFGVGSRSLATLYSLDLMSRVSFAFDDSTEKIGKYIPGTNIQILPSSMIEENEIELILLGVNFENEAKVLPKMRLTNAKIKSILPPSDMLVWGDLTSTGK